MPSVKVDNETYKILLEVKYRMALEGQKTSFSQLIRDAVLEKYKGTHVEKYESIQVEEYKSEQVKEDEGEQVEKCESVQVEESPDVKVHEEPNVQELIKEAVESVDAQKKRLIKVRKEVREVRTGACPSCGNIGTPIMALYTGEWIHRLLVKCDDCGTEYVSALGRDNLKHVSEFEKLKQHNPDCKLVKYEDFLKEYKVVRGLHEE